MKKVLVAIIVLVTLSRSGSLAQSRPNGFDMALDKKANEVRCVSCDENGFCVVEEIKSRNYHGMTIVHVDSAMQRQWDTTFSIPQLWRLQKVFYEDETLIIMGMPPVTKRAYVPDQMTIYLYNTASRTMETREVAGLRALAPIPECHYYQGNFIFKSERRDDEGVWFLPAGASSPFQFTFTQENRGRVLALEVDTACGKAVICFNSGERTMYFETDFHGKSSFANVINEAATGAQWIPVGKDHSVLMLYYQDDETFYMHPVNILNHRVMPSETLYCADIVPPKTLPSGVSEKQLIIVTPYSYISFLPTHAVSGNGRIACVTELYSPEYINYFNGWYVEPRFNGYRYDRADVHFFDTNGVFLTNVIFPYEDRASLHSSIIKVLNIGNLPNGDRLFYHLVGNELITMLLDGDCSIKSPVSTSNITYKRSSSGNRYKTVPVAVLQWFGNRFLLTSVRVKPASQRKVGILVTEMEYN